VIVVTLSERIKLLRKEKGLSQQQLADEISVSRQAVTKYETGDIEPSSEKIMQLSDFFGVSMDYLSGKSDIRLPHDDLKKLAIYSDTPLEGFTNGDQLINEVVRLMILKIIPEEDYNDDLAEKVNQILHQILLIFKDTKDTGKVADAVSNILLKLSYSEQSLRFFAQGDFNLDEMAGIGNALLRIQPEYIDGIRDLIEIYASFSRKYSTESTKDFDMSFENASVDKVLSRLINKIKNDIEKNQTVLECLEKLRKNNL
jgi:transcriptional regulator with XRE-family HTH domain